MNWGQEGFFFMARNKGNMVSRAGAVLCQWPTACGAEAQFVREIAEPEDYGRWRSMGHSQRTQGTVHVRGLRRVSPRGFFRSLLDFVFCLQCGIATDASIPSVQ